MEVQRIPLYGRFIHKGFKYTIVSRCDTFTTALKEEDDGFKHLLLNSIKVKEVLSDVEFKSNPDYKRNMY